MNYKLTIAYNGAKFYGFAKQKNLRTVQGLIENILNDLFGVQITIFGSGRTDRYVHALEQVISFKSKQINLDAQQLMNAINSRLDNDIHVLNCEIVDDKFHARFSAKSKTYIYKINVDKLFNPIESDIVYQYNNKVNLSMFEKYANRIIGTHNFLSFSTSEVDNTIRTIYDFRYFIDKNIITFYITGNGFLRNMVRMIIGVYFDLFEQKITFDEIEDYFKTPKKGKAIRKMNGCGLYLYKVNY